jgi:hypothetical protein
LPEDAAQCRLRDLHGRPVEVLHVVAGVAGAENRESEGRAHLGGDVVAACHSLLRRELDRHHAQIDLACVADEERYPEDVRAIGSDQASEIEDDDPLVLIHIPQAGESEEQQRDCDHPCYDGNGGTHSHHANLSADPSLASEPRASGRLPVEEPLANRAPASPA